MPQHLRELLTAADVANLLRLRISTVYDAAANGRLPVVRLWQGKRRTLIRFRPTDIQSFIDNRTTGAPVSPKPL